MLRSPLLSHHFSPLFRPSSALLSSQAFSTSPFSRDYQDTIGNLKIGASTRVIYQGFTGRVSTTNAQQSLEYGTRIVGGTTPGKSGEHLGLPLFPRVREAVEELKPDASAVFVGAPQAAGAIEEAIDAEIPLVVAVAEFIPLHEMLRVLSILKTQSKTRLVGANSPGIIAPLGNCRIGFQPLPCYLPGHVGVVAKSGTLSYETVGALTRAGLGQSLCIGMGGDIIAGTNLVEALQMFEHDVDTQAILLVGEVGGRAEQDAANWIREYKRRSSNSKPIAALVAGQQAPSGRIMGHAGAFASLGEDPAIVKHKDLEDAGVTMVSHPSKFPAALKTLIQRSGRDPTILTAKWTQKRAYHSIRRLRQSNPAPAIPFAIKYSQTRSLHLADKKAKGILKDSGISVTSSEDHVQDNIFLAITFNRTNRSPAIIASPTTTPNEKYQRARTFNYDYLTGLDEPTLQKIFRHIQTAAEPPVAMAALRQTINALVNVFKSKEAYALAVHVSGTADGGMEVYHAELGFDDSALKSGKRQKDIFSHRDTTREDPDEVEAEKDGIVYVKLDDPSANIGTLINGAGLAMNALDALKELGARPTNFLDTGGKATSETIKKSFALLLNDSRVRVIFVNIFGGLTLCDMIAEGVMLAFKNLSMKVPVVVRLRGTNEEKGQQMISESGLPLHAFDDFEEAAKKCTELANRP